MLKLTPRDRRAYVKGARDSARLLIAECNKLDPDGRRWEVVEVTNLPSEYMIPGQLATDVPKFVKMIKAMNEEAAAAGPPLTADQQAVLAAFGVEDIPFADQLHEMVTRTEAATAAAADTVTMQINR